MTMATQKPKGGGTRNKATLTTPTDRTIHVERMFNASRDRVWKAMTDPKLLAQWWGRGNKLVIEKLEVKRGGHWRFVEHADGQEHGFEGRYREVTPPERMSMTFEWDGMPGHVIVQTIELQEVGREQTKMTATSMFFTQEDRDGMMSSGMEGGMNESYAALDRVLEQMR
jgi:uncharacterized protein YndB with AHSA1/START domain